MGKLSFSKTSVLRGKGRATMSTLYGKFNSKDYRVKMTQKDIYTFKWWVETWRRGKPRVAVNRDRYRRFIICTDAGGNKIIAPIIINMSDFVTGGVIKTCASSATEDEWVTTFQSTPYIYGLAKVSLMATIWEKANTSDDRA